MSWENKEQLRAALNDSVSARMGCPVTDAEVDAAWDLYQSLCEQMSLSMSNVIDLGPMPNWGQCSKVDD